MRWFRLLSALALIALGVRLLVASYQPETQTFVLGKEVGR